MALFFELTAKTANNPLEIPNELTLSVVSVDLSPMNKVVVKNS